MHLCMRAHLPSVGEVRHLLIAALDDEPVAADVLDHTGVLVEVLVLVPRVLYI
jgi:hypothetical protein